MTLIPSESWQVKGVKGDTYKVGPTCDAPGCKRPVDHKHHLWRRSFLTGDFWWVEVPTGGPEQTKTIRNVVGLCWHHHEDVTGTGKGHRAWVRWLEDEEELIWLENDGYERWIATGTLSLPATPDESVAVGPARGREAERCPTCGRSKHKPAEHEPGPKRKRKSWTVKVPADAENGAEILDELWDEIAVIFGHDHYTSQLRRYYTLTQGAALILQNRELIAAEVDRD